MNTSTTFGFSSCEKIKQTVLFGSVIEALNRKMFTSWDLLNWLKTAEVNDLTLVAYLAVCKEIHPKNQYMDDGFHFLVYKPDYGYLAMTTEFNDQIPDQKDASEKDYNPIQNHILDQIIDYHNNIEVRAKALFLVRGYGTDDYILENLVLCYKNRNFPYLRLSNHQINIGLVDADWAEKFRYNEHLPSLVIKRVLNLQHQAPIYYGMVGYAIYHEVFKKLKKEKLLHQVPRDQLKVVESLFPGIIDPHIFDYSELGYKLALFGNDIAGYILGFPIQNMIPNNDQIYEAITLLTQKGWKDYVALIKESNPKNYIPSLPITDDKKSFANTHDVLMEEIDEYPPFDIVVYQDGSYIYRFTRAEFEQLLESKKNPWTNDWLPPTILSTIRSRADAAKELKFPPSYPMVEIFDRIEKGTLFETSKPLSVTSSSAPITSNTLSTWIAGHPTIIGIDEGILFATDINHLAHFFNMGDQSEEDNNESDESSDSE